MVVIRMLFLIFGFGIINAFVLSWGFVDIAHLYNVPYLKEFAIGHVFALFLLKGVLEGNTKVENEKRKAESEQPALSEEQLTMTIAFYFIIRMAMIVLSVGVAHLIYWMYS